MYLAHCLVKTIEIEDRPDLGENVGQLVKIEKHVSFFCLESSPAELARLLIQYQKVMRDKINQEYDIVLLSMTDMGKAISRTTILKLGTIELSNIVIAKLKEKESVNV